MGPATRELAAIEAAAGRDCDRRRVLNRVLNAPLRSPQSALSSARPAFKGRVRRLLTPCFNDIRKRVMGLSNGPPASGA